MGSRKRSLPVLQEIEVTDMGTGGKAIARSENQVVLISHAVPGDVVDVQITKKKKNYLEGFPVKFRVYSSLRSEPFCPHFGTCGGCRWQDLSYQGQLQFKQKQVEDQLARIANLGEKSKALISPILASPQEQEYRNKLEFTFSTKRWLTPEEIASGREINEPALGFHAPGRFDKVIDIQTCHLQQPPSNAIRNFVREYAHDHTLSYFNIRDQHGLLRNLTIRTSTTGEVMVLLSCFTHEKEKIYPLLTALRTQFPEITSLHYAINPKGNATLGGVETFTFAGKDHIIERLGNLKFKIGPKSFFQTNTKQAENLYHIAADFAGLDGKQNVYDLYSGTGTIALFLAGSAKQVVGIESIPEAVSDARENARINKISNAIFLQGDVREVFTEALIKEYGPPDRVILDPPRAGIHKDIIAILLRLTPANIVYISCNPSTQARDLVALQERYRVEKVQPVDMFPHTSHVENIVLLSLRQ